jgi:starvation-inducible outer membrane lipoprotein
VAAREAGNMKKMQLVTMFVAVAITGFALTGCSSITDQLQREKSSEFASVQDLTTNWNQTVA